jgi:hypothetical protein
MLVSHGKKFIFLKTVKTGGSSVEAGLQRFCTDPKIPYRDYTRGHRDSYGIVGYRGLPRLHWRIPFMRPKFRNHMSAKQICSAIGKERFDNYEKITSIRNPFDKVVSWFYFNLSDEVRSELRTASLKENQYHFEKLVSSRALPQDRFVYSINGRCVADSILKYETLASDYAELINRICPEASKKLPDKKRNSRNYRYQKNELITQKIKRIIIKQYTWEFENFYNDFSI